MRNAMWVGGGITGMGEIPMLGVREKGLAKVIRDIFSNDEKGFFYDPNDLSTMYQDAAGTNPVTAAGQPVGLILDKSKGLVLGSNLIPNGSFSSDTSWNKGAGWTIADGVARFDGSTSFSNLGNVASSSINGKWLRIELDLSNVGSSVTQVRVLVSGSLAATIPVSGAGKYSAMILGGSVPSIGIQSQGASGANYAFTLDNVSVKEAFGNHAYQNASASRPILGRTPEGGVRNIIVSSADRAHITWTHTGGTKELNVLDAKGTYNAARFSGTASSPPYILGSKAAKAGAHTLRIQVKAGSSTFKNATLLLRNNTTASNYNTGTIDLVTGSITGYGWSSKTLPNGFWECTFTQSTGISLNDDFNVYFGRTGATTSDFDIIVGEVQLEAGTQATAYQETRGLTNVTESGKKDVYFLAFDGSDDFLQTSNIDFTGTDKVSLFAGVRKLSDAATGMVCELSASSDASRKSFVLFAPSASGSNHYNFRSFGSSGSLTGTSDVQNFPAPHSAVLRATGGIGTNTCELFINGGSKQSSPTSQGTGNYGNYPLYIGRRGGTTLAFNGHIYGLIGVGKLTSDSETSVIEKELAKRTGVKLS